MTKVLLVHQPVDGGVGRHVSDLTSGLAGRGYEVTVCGPRLPAGFPTNAELSEHVTLDLSRAVSPGADMNAVRSLARIVREKKPDVIHAHSSKSGVVARLGRAFNFNIPVIYTPHLYAFAGDFSRDLERFAYRQVERALAPLASRVVCVCEAEARLARALGPAKRVRVVYNGIPPAGDGSVDARMAELSLAGPVICAIALLQPRKGIRTLIDAAPGILASHPRVQFAIWGDGPSLDALRAQAERVGVTDAVHFLGLCRDPTAVLRGADVFIHPALAEAFPYVILEAMSVGAPIVASDVGGVGEAVVNGESGLLVEPGRHEPLARAVVDVLGDSERRIRMGEAARGRFERRFTLESMLDGLSDVYGEVC